MNKGMLFVISGPSASGKGTVVKELLNVYDDIGVSVSATTRAPRDDEKEGVNYFYITKQEFERRLANGEILEHTIYNNEYYGTPYAAVKDALENGRDIILEIEVEGAMQVKRLFPNAVTIMLTPPDFETLERRLRNRNSEKSEDKIKWRLDRAREEVKLMPQYDYAVVNEDGKVRECADLIYTIISAERIAQRGTAPTEQEKEKLEIAERHRTKYTQQIIKKFI